MRITFLGHSTVQIEEGGTTVLTDPVFSRKVLTLKRQAPFPVDPSTLPDPTAVFLSHAHYDHLDLPTYKYFSTRTTVVLPTGLKGWLSRFLPQRLVEMAPGAVEKITPDLEAKAFPVAHTGWRLSGLRFRNCNGYLIRLGGRTVFFPGDTGYRDFRATRQMAGIGGIDVALLPIGAYRPEWIMEKRHLDPPRALKVFEEIGARVMIPIHWGTFRVSTEPLDEPVAWLRRLVEEKKLDARVQILKPGESHTLAG